MTTPTFNVDGFDVQKALSECQIKDRHRFYRKYRAITSKTPLDQSALISLLEHINASQQKSKDRAFSVDHVTFPDLPVTALKNEIKTLINDHQIVIIAGETGSGKTTQLPKMCLELGLGVHGMIGHTQPRRLAARSVANRLCEELETSLNDKVGFKVRFTDTSSDTTLIKLMTDGILLAEIQNDRFLNAYDTIIIDEAHERSLNIDFLLGYLKQLLPRRPDLKVIITSATIDPQRFSTHFNNAPVLEVSGRTYPVDIRYQDPETLTGDEPFEDLGVAIDELLREPKGDILVFFSGERDIRDAAEYLRRRQLRNTEILPLFARLSSAEQQKIFHPKNTRRIILATNVAETSLTVPGIKYVIDTGVARISRYNPRTKIQRLPIEAISQASGNQRSGRCGRTSNGIAIRLYTEDDYNARPEFTDPEIRRTHLSSVILQMLALKLGDIKHFPFVQPPDQRQITDGIKLLEELQAIKRTKGQLVLTQTGRLMAKIPLDPRYARMLLEANKHNAVADVLIIIAGLSIQDPRERPQEKQQQADTAHSEFIDKDSDFISILNLWNAIKGKQTELSNNQLRKWCAQRFINFQRVREWQDIVSQVKQVLSTINLSIVKQAADDESIHKSMLIGMLSQFGMKAADGTYQGCRNTQFAIFPGSAVFKSKPKWVMVSELVETSKLYARKAAKIQPQWLEPISDHLYKKHFVEPFWSKKRGAAQAYLNITLFGLPIVARRIVEFSKVDPAASRDLFIRDGLLGGMHNMQYAFLKKNSTLIESTELLENKTRSRDYLVDENVLVEFYQERLPQAVTRVSEFKQWWQKHSTKAPDYLDFTLSDLLKNDPSQVTKDAYPDVWQQGNLLLPIEYTFNPGEKDDGIAIRVPISVLNQLSNVGFDWLVKGFRYDLILSYIKSLPKAIRRNFVPAPNFASACIDIQAVDKKGNTRSLKEALAEKLLHLTGHKVDVDDFALDNIPDHLRMTFTCVNDDNVELGAGKDLTALKRKFSSKMQDAMKEVASEKSIEKNDISTWDFEQIPEVFNHKQAGYQITAYPALEFVDNKINLKVFDQKKTSDNAHQLGVVQLIKRNIPSPIKHLQKHLPNKAKLTLHYNAFGNINVLIDDLILASIKSLCEEKYPLIDIRGASQFKDVLEHSRANINDKALALATTIEKGLALGNQISKQCKGNIPLPLINHVSHIKQQLNHYIYKGFIFDFGEGRLNDWVRYLRALATRADKLKIDPNRDRLNQLELDKIQARVDEVKKNAIDDGLNDDTLREVQLMIEEFKVSLFAQQLGTKFPISSKRIITKLGELRR
ncbi:MAG: ATP-dependent RNA helicase HrpA [Pseudomonadota bacterium]